MGPPLRPNRVTLGRKEAASRKLRARWLVIAALMALIALGLWLGSAYTWASYHYRRAQRHLARHELTEALADFALCRKVWPSDTETCLLAARTARRARVYDDARRLLQMYKNLG